MLIQLVVFAFTYLVAQSVGAKPRSNQEMINNMFRDAVDRNLFEVLSTTLANPDPLRRPSPNVIQASFLAICQRGEKPDVAVFLREPVSIESLRSCFNFVKQRSKMDIMGDIFVTAHSRRGGRQLLVEFGRDLNIATQRLAIRRCMSVRSPDEAALLNVAFDRQDPFLINDIVQNARDGSNRQELYMRQVERAIVENLPNVVRGLVRSRQQTFDTGRALNFILNRRGSNRVPLMQAVLTGPPLTSRELREELYLTYDGAERSVITDAIIAGINPRRANRVTLLADVKRAAPRNIDKAVFSTVSEDRECEICCGDIPAGSRAMTHCANGKGVNQHISCEACIRQHVRGDEQFGPKPWCPWCKQALPMAQQ
jgi:hypothetical protein